MQNLGPAIEVAKTMAASPKSVEDRANIAFKLALVGKPEDRARLRAALLTDKATVLETDEAENYLREFDTAPDSDMTKAFVFTLYAGPEAEPIGVRGANSVPFTGDLDEIIAQILGRRSDLAIALARRLPRFRGPACNMLIQRTARINAWIAVASVIPSLLPPGVLPAAMADVWLLTRNQIVLVMSLAAAYGKTADWKTRAAEATAVVGGGVGWRMVARELVGMIPFGAGAPVKATIAYSGTVAVGKAALIYYQTGKRATPEEVRAAYEESQEEAKQEVEAMQE